MIKIAIYLIVWVYTIAFLEELFYKLSIHETYLYSLKLEKTVMFFVKFLFLLGFITLLGSEVAKWLS